MAPTDFKSLKRVTKGLELHWVIFKLCFTFLFAVTVFNCVLFTVPEELG